MTWREWNAATFLLADERYGIHIRRKQNEEEAKHQAGLAALRRERQT